MIKVDGSYLEAGGQIVRTALAFATLTQQPVEIFNIRKGRPTPGLKNQHLYCIKALQKLCNAKVEGAYLGSTRVRYYPQEIIGKTISIDIRTAGSITLLLQAVLLPSLFADTKVRFKIKGGTDVKFAPSFDYFEQVILPHIRIFTNEINITLKRRGYYPKGNGLVELEIKPRYPLTRFKNFKELILTLSQEINLTLVEKKEIKEILGISHASTDLEKSKVAERQSAGAKQLLASLLIPIKISSSYYQTLSTGSGITLWAKGISIGSDALGERGKRAELVGREAAQKLFQEINLNAPVDRHLADNLVPYIALVNGRIKTTLITQHTKTNIYVIEKFMGKIFNISKQLITAQNLLD